MSESLNKQVVPTLSEDNTYVCPITHEVPKDPVVASDGYTYERVAIEAWLLRCEVNDKYTSPITREEIEKEVYPNRLAKRETLGDVKSDVTLHGLVTDLNLIKRTLQEKLEQITAIQDKYEQLQYENNEISLKLNHYRDLRVERLNEECEQGKLSALFVKTLLGQTYTIRVILDKHTVEDFADIYAHKVGIPASVKIRLIFAGPFGAESSYRTLLHPQVANLSMVRSFLIIIFNVSRHFITFYRFEGINTIILII